MVWFFVASLTPAVLLALACVLGGPFPAMAVIAITVFVFVMDRLVSTLIPDTGETSPASTALPVVVGLVHGVLWVLGVTVLGSGILWGGDQASLVDRLLIFTGLGLWFGQISNSNAHELIHTPARLTRRLGIGIYCSVLFGHHASAHTKVHHIHAATRHDPNTARLGEGFWRYLIRATRTGYGAGRAAEDALRTRSKSPQSQWTHPYVGYAIGASIALNLAFFLSGLPGVLALLGLASYAQIQLYLSDYVQHYGLERQEMAPGKYEPMDDRHSWNAPHWYSSAMMLNAPRHSDHHTHPSRAFVQLRHSEETMPTLPHSLPVMAVLALVPPLWRRIMDHRALAWSPPAIRIAAQ